MCAPSSAVTSETREEDPELELDADGEGDGSEGSARLRSESERLVEDELALMGESMLNRERECTGQTGASDKTRGWVR